MGAYLYRIKPTPIGTFEGKPVYPAVYAYKPYWGFSGERENARLEFKTGVARTRKAWERKPEAECREVIVASEPNNEGEYRLYLHRNCCGALIDDSPNGFDQKPLALTWKPRRAGQCPDCGAEGERVGHMGCMYPQDHSEDQ